MSIQVTGTDGIRRDMNRVERLLFRRAGRAMEAVVEDLEEKVLENISLTDHSLEDLRNMGHPYALAHPNNPHDPPYLVHEQEGDLKKCIKSGVEIQLGMGTLGRDVIVGFVGADEDECPHARHVIMGTSKMISRDFLTETLDTERDSLEREFRNRL